MSAASHSCAEAPVVLIEPTAPTGHGTGYRRRYRVAAAPGDCLVQRVQVRIRYLQGGATLADYRQDYFEYFAFAPDAPAGAHAIDLHDFDVVRDGWRQTVMLGLLRRCRAAGASPPRGAPGLLVQKRFTMAHGTVRGGEPRLLAPGVSFGFCAFGPGGASAATLRLSRGDGTWTAGEPLRACPPGPTIAGEAAVFAADAWRAVERFRYDFATLRGRFADRASYQPIGPR